MCDNTLAAGVEHSVGHLFVRRDPAKRVLLPAKLRKRRVEPSRESRQHDIVVEVSDSLLRLRRRHFDSSRGSNLSLYQIWVGYRKWIFLNSKVSGYVASPICAPNPFAHLLHGLD